MAGYPQSKPDLLALALAEIHIGIAMARTKGVVCGPLIKVEVKGGTPAAGPSGLKT